MRWIVGLWGRFTLSTICLFRYFLNSINIFYTAIILFILTWPWMCVLNIFKLCWIGEASLAKAFWIVYVLFNLILIVLLDFLVDIFVAHSFTPLYIHNQYMDLIITLAFPYLLFSAMCVWICSKNASRFWRLVSKIVILIPIIFCTFHITRY